MSIHDGHRDRMRRQLKTSGMDSLSDVQVLEVLLYYAAPRGDTNPAYLNSGLSVFTVSFTVSSAELKQYKKHGEIIEALRSLDYVYYIEEMN